MNGRRALVVFAAVALGVTAGWATAQHHLARHRADLFSPRSSRRLAALGYLAGHYRPDTLRLLRDYVSWEETPLLRRRAARLVRRMETVLA